MNSEYNNWNEEHTVMILDGPIVRPAPTPKRDLTPEEVAEIEARAKAIKEKNTLSDWQLQRRAEIRRCS
mgnify:CR=1 FL=1|tara:strand:+ start:890 stop:1096 length:207 start_codon:yes stop_codon:yes gene_type:complete